jgi:hypothetical protein
MARLTHESSGDSFSPGGRALVGRGRVCTIQINDPRVSGEHASLVWKGGQEWELRDLVSRNGTWVDGTRLEPGERRALSAGSKLAFGSRKNVWVFHDDSPPSPLALCQDDDARVSGDVLALPSEEDPQVAIFRMPDGRWIAEGPDFDREVFDQDVISADGRAWRLLLPVESSLTQDGTSVEFIAGQRALSFKVSRDEEYVEVTVHVDGQAQALKPRAHHYLLLTLARARMDDLDASGAERGWVYADMLARSLRMDRRTLNVHIHRSRKELSAAGGGAPGEVVQRRPNTNQIRLGFDTLSVESL